MTFDIAQQRLVNQRLVGVPFANPVDAVAALGAVQAQEYPGGKWALGLRTQGATEADIDRAFNDGDILRTHVMRPTWHFVTPDDIRWLLALTGPRVHAVTNSYYRKNEIDDALAARVNAIFTDVLRDGNFMTRPELGAVLAEKGIPTDNLRLSFLVAHAELDAVICSGPRRGKQFTYALLDERAPNARVLARDEALAELTRRYFTSHGPATLKDFSWWSGLTQADAKMGIDMLNGEIAHEDINGTPYWFAASTLSGSAPATPARTAEIPAYRAHLLPTYDEFLIAYSGFDKSRSAGRDLAWHLVFYSTMIVDGRVVGSWNRTLKKKAVTIELAPFEPLSPDDEEAINAAVQRFGDFFGLPVVLAVRTP